MKKQTVLTGLVLLLFCATICAQDTVRIHKYLALLQHAKNDTSRVNAMRSLGSTYANSNPDSAIAITWRALALAEQINWVKGIAACSMNMGYYFDAKNAYDSALFYSNKALTASVKAGDKNRIAQVYINRGSFYVQTLHYAEAMNDFKQALQISTQVNNQDKMARCNMSFGSIYLDQGNYAAALPYYQKALLVFTGLKDTEEIANAGGTVGSIYLHLKNYKAAEQLLQSAVDMELKIDDYFRLTDNYNDLGTLYMQQNQTAKGINMLQLAVKNAVLYGDPKMVALAYSYLGDAYLTGKQLTLAKNAFTQGLHAVTGINSYEANQANYLGLARALHETGDDKNAYINFEKSSALNDTISVRKQQKELLRLQTQFETEEKEKENLLLKAENMASSAELKQNKLLLVAAIAGMALLGAFLYAMYRNRQAKIKNIEALQGLNKQLEGQRAEIARINILLQLKALRAQMNPHFIFNCMSAIQECMLTGRLAEANTYLSKLSRLLRMVLVYSDEENITLDKELEILQIYLQLEHLRARGSFDYTVDIDEEIITEDMLVPALLLQPFAENAIWHGLHNKTADKKLSVSVHLKGDLLYCIIEDNGIGRQQAALLKAGQTKHASRGVQLVEKRLQILKEQTQQPVSITITDLYDTGGVATGTRVEIVVPSS